MKKTVLSTELFGKESVFTETGKNFLAAIIASSEDAIITKDLDGIITSWNEGARRIFGYQAEEIVGQSIRRLIPEELQHEEDAILAKLRAGERIRHFETTRVRKNGERFPISVTISPVKDDSGVIIGASKIARDISDRRRAEENRFRLAAIVDSADDAIISKDLNGIVTSWNKGAQRLFGYLEEEMIGQPILRLIPEELQYEEKEILEKLHAGEKVEHYETTRLSKNGDLRQVSITISPIRNDAGKVIGASKIARDISERKKMEFLLVQAEKLAATGRMAAAIAHEINNPLASVLNLIFLARQSSASRAEIQEYLGTAESELERVSHIARQTLGYYRDNASPCEVHLHDLVQNVLSVYRTRLQAHNIVLETTFNDLRKIKVRPGEMIQVLSNVISNAMDAMPLGGSMSITVAPTKKVDRNGVQITVRDTGSGIPREHLDKVFEPFFTTKGNLGTGIGLWVANQLVQRHHGQISISSSTERGDSGTTVTIYLPFGSFEGTTTKPNGAQRDS
ncbi:PAS domain S-box protein [Terriglobus sp. 2YAB30_2]|uniref:PAS domain S-box protein n=2 Tax=unclassified Terriglobus TaxID=2628988 RepID=UPI003F960C1D